MCRLKRNWIRKGILILPKERGRRLKIIKWVTKAQAKGMIVVNKEGKAKIQVDRKISSYLLNFIYSQEDFNI